ncbi:MAG: DUF4038 domain-containing protein, partial [Armatimonadetes bacterium]|nr:DUF4038 domain-containing protein [Armatimonadota bacterium]
RRIARSSPGRRGGLRNPDTWPPKGREWFGVSRRLRSDITKGAPFPGGKGGGAAEGRGAGSATATLKSAFLLVNEVDGSTNAPIQGLWATNDRLYVSDPHTARIRIYNAETMEETGGWGIPRANRMAMDRKGTLWVIQKGDEKTPPQILGLAPQGRVGERRLSLPKGTEPTALAFDPQGRLLVADNGPNQQILIYSDPLAGTKLVGTFGKKGGIYAGRPGEFGDLKFNAPMGVGADRKGNLYVASDGSSGGGGTVLESYTPAGKLNWRLLGLEFVDMGEIDPASESDVYTKEERFRMDYSRPVGQEWTYKGYTIHRFKHPQDPRLHIWSAGAWVRRIEGKPFLFVTDMNAEHLQVYRFDSQKEGEIAVPAGLFAKKRLNIKGWPPNQPEKGEWIWRDANGNGAFDPGEYASNGGKDAPGLQGWWVDTNGNVWQATETEGIRMFPLKGLNAKGNPTWDYAGMKSFPHPSSFRQVKRIRYDPKADVLYLGGTTTEHANQHWKPMGPVIARYDGFLRSKEPKPTWQIVAPYEKGSSGHSSCEPMGFDAAGEYLFVPYTGASKDLGFSTGHIEVFRASDGSRVGAMEPTPEIGEIGLQDIRECLSARLRPNGEYLVFLEEDWKAKILMYRWNPNAKSRGRQAAGTSSKRSGAASMETPSNAAPKAGTRFPLKPSASGRYLADRENRPFLYHADTAWKLFLKLTREEAVEYLKDRKAKGFTTVQVILTGFMGEKNRERQAPFLAEGDFSRPNEAYFRHVDAVLREAEKLGLFMALAPAWVGCCGEGWGGRGKPLQANGPEKSREFGRFLGERYKNFNNIMWIMGGDNDPHEDREAIRQMALGIKEKAPHHLITYHAASSHSSTDVWPPDEKWIDVTMTYTYFRGFNKAWNKNQPDVYEVNHQEYRKKPVRPFFLGESTYEGEHGDWGSAHQARKQAYWSMLSGGMGHAYGSPNWNIPNDWREKMQLPGAKSLRHFYDLFASRLWHTLVPDEKNELAVGGRGEFATNNYAVTARSEDGRLAVTYLPTPRTITFDLSRMSGPVTARWFDPTNGSYKTVEGSPFSNQGTREYMPPPKNAAGDPDFLLLLEVKW